MFLNVGSATASVQSVLRNIEAINDAAFRDYVPKVYDGKVTFFCADEGVCPEEDLAGWRRLAAGGVDVLHVPGDHQTMIKEPHVAKLALSLEEAIQTAAGETPTTAAIAAQIEVDRDTGVVTDFEGAVDLFNSTGEDQGLESLLGELESFSDEEADLFLAQMDEEYSGARLGTK